MKAGKLVHVIQIQRVTDTVNDAGTPSRDWTSHIRLRAEVVRRSAEEFLTAGGEADEVTIVFRTRYVSDLTCEDRIAFDGDTFDIDEITRIGRRHGLELRCRRRS